MSCRSPAGCALCCLLEGGKAVYTLSLILVVMSFACLVDSFFLFDGKENCLITFLGMIHTHWWKPKQLEIILYSKTPQSTYPNLHISSNEHNRACSTDSKERHLAIPFGIMCSSLLIHTKQISRCLWFCSARYLYASAGCRKPSC